MDYQNIMEDNISRLNWNWYGTRLLEAFDLELEKGYLPSPLKNSIIVEANKSSHLWLPGITQRQLSITTFASSR